jgi:hypothetical protein
MDLYRDIDIQAITDRLDTIVEEATKEKLKKLRPTAETLMKIRNMVLDFVRENKRVVYGGTAYNELIKQKNKKDAIYSEVDEPIKDVEFYSPDPVGDMVALCNKFKPAFEFVEGREAMHNETFSIFVEFNGSCDISYMPKHIFNNMPKVVIDNIHFTHPSWILVDILRQYNDPLTSYWRLKDKTFFRANVLIKHYPLVIDQGKPTFPKSDTAVNTIVFDKIVSMPTLIHIGSIAYNFYMNPKNKTIDPSLPLVCYSTQLLKDASVCYDLLIDKYPKDITVKEYVPFFQFWDRKVVYYYKDYPVLTLVGSNMKCIPYNTVTYSKNKIKRIQLGGVYRDLKGGAQGEDKDGFKLGTFMLLFMYQLIEMHYNYINKFKMQYRNSQNILAALLKTRKEYLAQKNITVIDKSPFQEFVLDCFGNTQDQLYEAALRRTARKRAGKMIILRYDPVNDNPDDDRYKINFANTSGNIITNKNRLLVQKAFQETTTSSDQSLSSET